MTVNDGYYRMPTVFGDKIVFVSEDDLWEVNIKGGSARRLTTTNGSILYPFFSPDGKWIAFSAAEEGSAYEVYVMPAEGGPIKRLTYLGAQSNVRGWTPDGKYVLFESNAHFNRRVYYLYKVSLEGGEPERLPFGPARFIHMRSDGKIVLGRFQEDNARWKRYRGGLAGDIWVDATGDGIFNRLVDLKGNLVRPFWFGERVIFLSDHEGVSNIYSVNTDGTDLQRITDHKDYYVRFMSTDGKRIVYQCAGDIYYLDDVKNGQPRKVEIQLPSTRPQRHRKYVSASKFLEDAVVTRNDTHLSVITRGKPFYFAFWEGGVLQLGEPQGVHYRLPTPLNENRIALISDRTGEERLEIYRVAEIPELEVEFSDFDLGLPYGMKASPDGKYLAISNHRNELLLVAIEEKKLTRIAKNDFYSITDFDWSPDSRWVVYSAYVDYHTIALFLYHLETEKTYQITPSEFMDYKPVFDPQGKYIFFISRRSFDPMMDAHSNQRDFPKGRKICVITLKKDEMPPTIPQPQKLVGGMKDSGNKNKEKNSAKSNNETDKAKEETPQPVEIDIEGIQNRITVLPLPEDRYIDLAVAKDRIFYLTLPVVGDSVFFRAPNVAVGELYSYNLKNLESKLLMKKVTMFRLSDSKETLLIRSGERLRVLPYTFEPKPQQMSSPQFNKPSRKSGWIDLNRVKVLVEPEKEWEQMLQEAWRLMREHYWDKNMKGNDWKTIYEKYKPLLRKVATRSEFSDLVWEMQGELGTSHAYEMFGDYRQPPPYRQGFLGADFEYDKKTGGYKITHIVDGDNWNPETGSPLATPGANIHVGDVILAINGQKVSKERTINELLMNLAKQYVTLTVVDSAGKNKRNVVVKTIETEAPARYREWVKKNRQRVHEATNGRVGYIHIPDMMFQGMAEFTRAFRSEANKEGLIIDVRFNGGGNVSQLILERLSRKRIAYIWRRYGKIYPYPDFTIKGPKVAITNEFAGSDGDIFSHGFKMLKLGPLIGKRTWGGVIGINPRRRLVDGSIVTQPEFAFWFMDVEWGVENYGTDPDIEIEYAPQDYAQNKDPQLEKAISLVLEKLDSDEFPQKVPSPPS